MAFKSTTQKLTNAILSNWPGRNAIFSKINNFSTTRVNSMQLDSAKNSWKWFSWGKWALPAGGLAVCARNWKPDKELTDWLEKNKLYLVITAGLAGCLALRRSPSRSILFAAPPAVFCKWGYFPDEDVHKFNLKGPGIEEVHLPNLHFFALWKWQFGKEIVFMIRTKEAFDEKRDLKDWAQYAIRQYLTKHPSIEEKIAETEQRVAEDQLARGPVRVRRPTPTSTSTQTVPIAVQALSKAAIPQMLNLLSTSDSQPSDSMTKGQHKPSQEQEAPHHPLLIDCPPSTSTFDNFPHLKYL